MMKFTAIPGAPGFFPSYPPEKSAEAKQQRLHYNFPKEARCEVFRPQRTVIVGTVGVLQFDVCA